MRISNNLYIGIGRKYTHVLLFTAPRYTLREIVYRSGVFIILLTQVRFRRAPVYREISPIARGWYTVGARQIATHHFARHATKIKPSAQARYRRRLVVLCVCIITHSAFREISHRESCRRYSTPYIRSPNSDKSASFFFSLLCSMVYVENSERNLSRKFVFEEADLRSKMKTQSRRGKKRIGRDAQWHMYTMLERTRAVAKARNVSLNCVTGLLPGEIATFVKPRLHV